jgi:cytochrome c oxidase subunit I+III
MAASGKSALLRHKDLQRAWCNPPGWGRLAAVNHSIIGRRFILTALAFFAIGGLLAMLLRAQLATSRSAFVGPEIYNQFFTMHGTVMMFLFAIPLFEGLAMYLLPKMLGSRDMAFPRLSAYGYWCYVLGGSILVVALAIGYAPDSGWFMYTPLSSKPYTPGINSDVWLIGITFVEISAISAAVEIAVSILRIRTGGMSLQRLPIFAWYMLVTAFMILVGFPPLILGSILLEVERAFGWPFFDPTRGGDPLLWQHLFWMFGHPEVYIIFLPAAGAISTILPVLSRQRLIGYSWLVASIIALGFISFGLWVHHMFTTGLPHLSLAFFSAASLLVVIPTSVQIFSWLATLVMGRPQLKLPMLYILGFFFVFVMGGLTGVMVGVVPFDWQAHDTHFVVAHLHYVLVGGFVFPMLAAAYYWLPRFTGRQAQHRLGLVAFWLIFLGFHGTFFLMHLTGLRGMPRRIFTYPVEMNWDVLNLISSMGSFVMAAGFALFVVDIILQLRFAPRSCRNPWQADTLEWTVPGPVPLYNFAALPHIRSRYPLKAQSGLALKLATGDGYLPEVRHGWMETLSVDMVSGRPDQIVLLPKPTYLPFFAALATAVFFLGALFKIYGLALAGLATAMTLFLVWAWHSGLQRDYGALPAGLDLSLPLHAETKRPPAWWAMAFTLVADGTMFASLLFGGIFLLVVTPGEVPPAIASGAAMWLDIVIIGLLASAVFAMRRTVRAVAMPAPRQRLIGIAFVQQLLAAALLVYLIRAAPDAKAHAVHALSTAMLWYLALHVMVALVMTGFTIARGRCGYISATRSAEPRILLLWYTYVALAGLIGLALLRLISPVAP